MTHDQAVLCKKVFKGFQTSIDNDHVVCESNPEYHAVRSLFYVRVTQNYKKGVTVPRSFIVKRYNNIVEVGLGSSGIGFKRFNGDYTALVNELKKV